MSIEREAKRSEAKRNEIKRSKAEGRSGGEGRKGKKREEISINRKMFSRSHPSILLQILSLAEGIMKIFEMPLAISS